MGKLKMGQLINKKLYWKQETREAGRSCQYPCNFFVKAELENTIMSKFSGRGQGKLVDPAGILEKPQKRRRGRWVGKTIGDDPVRIEME